MKISANKFVSVSYDLYVGEGDERELMERATEEHPLQFIFGTDSMLPAFEVELKGLDMGAAFQFTLTPENAYGEFSEDNIVELPKNLFEVEGKFDSEYIKEGNTIPMMDSTGQRLMGSVHEVKDDVVVMDFNHPLASETLHFSGKVIDVHEPTVEEMALINAEKHSGCDGGCDGCGSDCNTN